MEIIINLKAKPGSKCFIIFNNKIDEVIITECSVHIESEKTIVRYNYHNITSRNYGNTINEDSLFKTKDEAKLEMIKRIGDL